MTCDLLIFGASGHAKVAADCARAAYPRMIMLSGENTESAWRGIPILPESQKTLAEWRALCPRAFVAIGSAARRELVTARLVEAGFRLVTLLHPSAEISPSAEIGEGSLVCPLAVINADARLGRGCIVNTGAIVEHECRLDDFSHLSPGAVLAGGVSLGARAWVCAGAVVANNLTIGADSTVGAGAAVIGNVPEKVLAAGVPAEVRKRYEG